MADRLEDIRTFVAVAEQRSFAAAAIRIGVVKSAVSRRISDLEARLGVQLVARTSRRFSLTSAGSAFYERCIGVLEGIAEAEAEVSQGAARIAGPLRVAGPMSFGMHCLTAPVVSLLQAHPDLLIELELDDRFVDLVGERFDVAVRISALKDSTLIARRLAPIRHALCASPAYLARYGTPQRPEDLRAHRGIIYSNVDGRSYWRLRDPATGASPQVEIPSALRVNNGDAMREAAMADFGIVSLPTFIIHKQVAAGALCVFMTEWEPPPIAVHAVYPGARHLPARVRAFIDFLVARFGPTPHWDRDVFGPAAPSHPRETA